MRRRKALTTTRRSNVSLAMLAVAAVPVLCSRLIQPAQAQLIQEDFPADIPGYSPSFNASVGNRMLLQGQADGIEAGGMVIRPNLSETTGYNSDTLGMPNTGSGEVLTQAGVRVNSDWTRNSLGASLSVQDHRYTSLPEANFTDFTSGLGGIVSLGNDSLTLGYSHLAQHLTATDLGQTGIVAPVPFSVDDIRIAYEKLFGRFSLTPSFAYDVFQFGKSGTTIVVNDKANNHQVETEKLAWRYELAPGEGLVGIVQSEQAQFGNAPGNGYFDAGVFAGFDDQAVAIFEWRALAAFETRRFRTAGSQDVSTPVFEVDAIWTPTQLDTVTATASRQLADAASPFARNQTVTEARGEIDHELRSNVFATAHVQYGNSLTQSSVAGIGNGSDTQLSFGTAAYWYVNRHFDINLSYQLLNNDTTGGLANVSGPVHSPSFLSNSILLGIHLQE